MATYTAELITTQEAAEKYFFGEGFEFNADFDRILEDCKDEIINKNTVDRSVGGLEPMDGLFSWEQVKNNLAITYMSYAESRNLNTPEDGDHYLRILKKDGYMVGAMACVVDNDGYLNLCDSLIGRDQNGSKAWWYSEEFQKWNADYMKSIGATGIRITFAKDSYMKEQFKTWFDAFYFKIGLPDFETAKTIKQRIHTYDLQDVNQNKQRYVVEMYEIQYTFRENYLE